MWTPDNHTHVWCFLELLHTFVQTVFDCYSVTASLFLELRGKNMFQQDYCAQSKFNEDVVAEGEQEELERLAQSSDRPHPQLTCLDWTEIKIAPQSSQPQCLISLMITSSNRHVPQSSGKFPQKSRVYYNSRCWASQHSVMGKCPAIFYLTLGIGWQLFLRTSKRKKFSFHNNGFLGAHNKVHVLLKLW